MERARRAGVAGAVLWRAWRPAPSPSASRSATAPPPRPSAASQLDPAQLAGRAARRRLRGHRAARRGPERAIREGRVAGVILFADNFPSRAAGRRADRRAAGDPPPAGPARPAAGDDRPGGRAGEAGRRRARPPRPREMGARGAAFSREQGARTAANLRDARRQRRPGPGPRRRPPRQRHRRDRTRLRLQRRARSRPPRSPSPRRCRRAASRPPPSTSPGLGAPADNTDFAVQRIGLSKATLRAVDEAPYRAFVEAGGELVMLSTRDLPGALAEARRLRAARSRPASCAPASASRASRSPTRSAASPSPTSAARPRPASPPPAPAPTSCSSPTYQAGARAGEALVRAAALRARCGRAEFEASAGRVLRLRHELAG